MTNCSPFPGARLGIFGPCGWSRCFNKSWNGSGLGEIALADLVSPFSCCTWLLTKGYLLVGMRCLACDSLFRVEDSLSTLWLMGLDREFEKAWLLRLHWIEWDAKNQAIALLSIDWQGVKFVKDDLDFDNADSDVSVFELTIRGFAPERVIQFLKGTWEETNYIGDPISERNLGRDKLHQALNMLVGQKVHPASRFPLKFDLSGWRKNEAWWLARCPHVVQQKGLWHRFCPPSEWLTSKAAQRVIGLCKSDNCNILQRRAIRSYWSVRKSWETACCLHFKHPPGTCFQILFSVVYRV